jgi:nucleoside-diphosphate-sugar epimerase
MRVFVTGESGFIGSASSTRATYAPAALAT